MSGPDFTLATFSLAGRRALVSGGNSGLGSALTRGLRAAGAEVMVASLGEPDPEAAEVPFVSLDLTEPGAPDRAVAACLEQLGSIDILVNCAGLCVVSDDVRAFGRDQWDPMVAVNLTAAFELSRAAATPMIDQRSGAIINVCSVFSFLGGRGSPAYAATKHGLAGLTRAYADELAPHGIRVNAIAPGYVRTEMTRATYDDPEGRRRIEDHIPAGRWATPEDLIGATVFLAGDAAAYVNGHLLAVDGGYLLR